MIRWPLPGDRFGRCVLRWRMSPNRWLFDCDCGSSWVFRLDAVERAQRSGAELCCGYCLRQRSGLRHAEFSRQWDEQKTLWTNGQPELLAARVLDDLVLAEGGVDEPIPAFLRECLAPNIALGTAAR